MVRWFRLYGNQFLGFWFLGFALFVLQEVPYLVMPLFKLRGDPLMNMRESSVILDITEKALGTLCILLMTFIVREDTVFFSIGHGISKAGFIMAVIVLLLNYFGWGLYFAGHQSFGVIMFFIVFLPPLYYTCIALWRNNPMLFVTGVLFELIHFIHVYGNLRS